MEKETEIEGLARMVAEGFSSMQQYMDKKFDSFDERFDAVDLRFDRVEERLDTVESTLDSVEMRLGAVEIIVTDTNRLIDTAILPTLNEHSSRIKDLEMHV